MINEKIKFNESRGDEERLEKIGGEILKFGDDIRSITREDARELKNRVLTQNPGYEQEIEFIFSVVEQMIDQVEYDELKGKNQGKIESSTSKRLNESFAESLYLETDYILHNRQNKKYLSDLLNLCRELTEKLNVTREWQRAERGLIGQVGVNNFMEKFGLSPRLAKPKEDAFGKIDFWGKSEQGETLAVQGKSMWFIKQPAYLDSDMRFRQWFSQEEKKLKAGNDYKALDLLYKLQDDYLTIKRSYANRPDVKPAVVVLPTNSYDPSNGGLNEKYFKNFKFTQ